MTTYRYDTRPGEWSTNSSHYFLFEWARAAHSVLDVGCSTGALGASLIDAGCTVVGVDVDAAAVEVAKSRGVDARICDLGVSRLAECVDGKAFDCIVFGDVLEHLVDPGSALDQARDVLAPDGFVVISVPNVSHASVVLSLMVNRWDGRAVGLLDKTHLRFFTLDSITDLVEAHGYLVADVKRVVSELTDPTQEPTLAMRGVHALPDSALRAAQSGPECDTLQFVLRLEPIDPGPISVDQVRSSLIDARIALRDARRDLMAVQGELAFLRRLQKQASAAVRSELAARDEIVALEAACARTKVELAEQEALNREIDALRCAQIADIQASVAWRLGRLATAPARLVRYVLTRLR